MSKSAFHILRVGLGTTFLWVGILILKEPLSWAGYLHPWALTLSPFSPEVLMMITGIFDVALGVLFLLNLGVRVAGFLAALHMVGILVGGGVNDITVRDIGLLTAGLALGMDANRFTGLAWWK